MAYATTNPPRLAFAAGLTGAGQRWVYRSSDAAATVDASGYFTNADDLGMLAGDIVEVHDTVTKLVTTHYVHSVTVSSAADLGTGVTIGSSANAD